MDCHQLSTQKTTTNVIQILVMMMMVGPLFKWFYIIG